MRKESKRSTGGLAQVACRRDVSLQCLLLLALSTPALAAGSGKVVTTTTPHETVVDGRTRIIVLPPKLTYEQLRDERVLDAASFEGSSIQADMREAARSVLTRKGFGLTDTLSTGGDPSETTRRLHALEAAAESLGSPRGVPVLSDTLKALGADDEHLAVLATYVRVKVGQAGTWNSMTGAITSASHSARMRAAIVECRTARILWKNEVLLREIPRVDSAHYREAVQALFNDVQKKEE